MGIGDEILASAQARHVYEQLGEKADFSEYHPKVWKGNPMIARQRGGIPVRNRTGDRPYVLLQTPQRVIFNPNYHALPGDIFFNKRHFKEARNLLGKTKNFVMIEPHTKDTFSKGNKSWEWDKWVELSKRLDLPIVQTMAEKKKTLPNAKRIITDNAMIAFAILTMAKFLITTDGALHHAAAASYYEVDEAQNNYKHIGTGVPAVVIWTGFSHPQQLGYNSHINVRADDSPACGMKVECKHCRDMSKKVTVDMVYNAYKELT